MSAADIVALWHEAGPQKQFGSGAEVERVCANASGTRPSQQWSSQALVDSR